VNIESTLATGNWSGILKSFKVISPIDNSAYLQRDYATAKEIEGCVKAANNAKQMWKDVDLSERAKICHAMLDEFLKHKSQIAEEITWQMGRPNRYTLGEVNGFIERARYMISIAEKKLSPILIPEQDDFNRYIERVPLGVIFVITPWNYPFLTAVNTIIPAIMAGNVVIMKPSAQAPLTAERIDQAFKAVNLPDGVFQYLYLTHQQTDQVIGKSAINHVAFTGSVPGGLEIQKYAKKRFISVGLELGGKDPAYVREDADLQYAIVNLVDGVYFNSGQSCCGVERIYVDQSVYEQFVEGFVEQVKRYKLGDPLDSESTLGPMMNKKSADFVRSQIADAVQQGAEKQISNKEFEMDAGYTAYLAPQVLLNVDHSMRIMKEESFGPVVGIMKVNSDDQAIELMNDSDFGLTASIWTQNMEQAESIGRAVNTGTVFMNRCDYLDPALAWVGVKNSGQGCTLSEIGYEQLTRPKSFNLRKV